MAALEIQIAEKPVVLLPQRAAFLPECGTLLVADLHLGRQHAWRGDGMPIGEAAAAASLEEPLERLALAVRETGARRVRVLGDLLHAPSGLTTEMIARVAQWRTGLRVPLELIPGNHDRRLDLVLREWDMQLHDSVVIEPPFAFTHEPASAAAGACAGTIVWCGHVHPLVHLRTRGDSLRLPCFCFGSAIALLPAFSGMSSGATIRPQVGERVYAITDDSVIDVSEGASTPRVRTVRRVGSGSPG